MISAIRNTVIHDAENLFQKPCRGTKKWGLSHIVSQEKSQKISLKVLESPNLPKLQDLDTETQISKFEWTFILKDVKFF